MTVLVFHTQVQQRQRRDKLDRCVTVSVFHVQVPKRQRRDVRGRRTTVLVFHTHADPTTAKTRCVKHVCDCDSFSRVGSTRQKRNVRDWRLSVFNVHVQQRAPARVCVIVSNSSADSTATKTKHAKQRMRACVIVSSADSTATKTRCVRQACNRLSHVFSRAGLTMTKTR